VIEIPDMDMESFHALLNYLYTGNVSLSETNTVQLMAASHHYQLVELKDSCVQFASKTLETYDALEYLRVGILCNESKFIERCFTYIDEKIEDILLTESLFQLSKELFVQILLRDSLQASEISLFKGLLRWKEKNDSQAAKELTKLIRIPQIDAKDIIKTVKPSKLVSEEVLFASMAYHAAPDEYQTNPDKMFQPRAFGRKKFV